MNLRNLLTALLLTFATLQGLQAQVPNNGVMSFTVSVPDAIVQGVPFEVKYTLKATHWTKGMPKQGGSLMLNGVRYNKIPQADHTILESFATYVTSLSGQMELPRMGIIVDGEEVLSETRQITVQPHPHYGEEMSYAHRWLVAHGQHADSICVTMDGDEQDLLLFSDRYNKCFAVVARKAVWPLVGEPMLAYGVGCMMPSHQEDPDNYESVMQPFLLQIAAMKGAAQNGQSIQLPYQPKNAAVRPMLGQLQWGQGEPYNSKTTALTQKAVWVGCVPLAAAMTMSYHQWPERGLSHAYYKLGAKVYELDFTQCKPDWPSYKNHYDKEEENEVQNLSELLVNIGLAVDANFKKETTSANFFNVKHALCNNLGYSGKATIASELSEAETAAIIYRELDCGRPCIVSNSNHAFVCDGYEGDFMHFNFGWDGYFNGFYRLKLGHQANTSGQRRIMVKEVIYGIEPLRQPVVKEITTETPGTLDQLLSQEEKESTTQLKISGPLNSADIRLLRKMTGAPTSNHFDTWQGGALMRLDLSEARIVNDSLPYLTRPAKGTWTHREEIDGQYTERTYDFQQMDLEAWQQFVADMGNTQKGVSYSRTDDNRYWAHYNCQADTIGMFMFNECSSLQHIDLPKTTLRVGDYAFGNCQLLQLLRLPESVREVGWYPVNNCPSLEKLEMPQATQCKEESLRGCSPVLTAITRY